MKEINRENCEECRGCPFLKFKFWGKSPLEKGIKYLSFEYHSVCNMKCSYCSETYYGGKQASYDVEKLINEFKEKKALANVPHIVWGGGEPTLDRTFSKILKILDKENLENNKQRIITNAVKYLPEVYELINKSKVYIVVSIDAGTQETFKKLRGINKLDLVLKNLKQYSSQTPSNVIVKYIVLKDNCTDEEILNFINKMKEYDLLKCNFQLSCDFKSSRVEEHILIQICFLYCKLLEVGAEFIILDDLIWQRITKINNAFIEKLKKILKKKNLLKYLLSKEKYPEILVYGTGNQAELITQKTHVLKHINVKYFIDYCKEKQEKEIFNVPIISPNSLKNNDTAILIAAVQNAPIIYQQLLSYGYNKNLIIKDLVL